MSDNKKPTLSPAVIGAIALLLAWVFIIAPRYNKEREAARPSAPAAPAAPAVPGVPGEAQPEAPPAGEAPAPPTPPAGEAPAPPTPPAGEAAPPAEPPTEAPPEGPPEGPTEGPPEAPPEGPVDEAEPEPVGDIIVETDIFRATLTCRGGALRRLRFQPPTPGGGGGGGYSFDAKAPEEGLLILDELQANTPSLALSGLTPDGLFESCVYELVSADEKYHPVGNDEVKRVVWRARARGFEVTKAFTFPKGGLDVRLEVKVKRTAKAAADELRYRLRGPAGIAPDSKASRYVQLTAVLAARPSGSMELEAQWHYGSKAASQADKHFVTLVESARKRAESEGKSFDESKMARPSEGDVVPLRIGAGLIEWAAVKNRYFAAILYPDEAGIAQTAYAHPLELSAECQQDPVLNQPNVMVGLKTPAFALAPGAEVTHRYKLYAGPLAEDELGIYGPEKEFNRLVTYGWSKFDWLSRALRYLLVQILYRAVRNYGLAIILLTIIVKGLLHPLTRKSMISMQKMQKLQPEIQAIKKKYESDKSPEAQRKMMREQQDLFSRHGVSPLGGCLPMLVQIPMLFALFGCFRGSFELRQAGFLWISDLSQPDNIFALPFTFPLTGWTELNLLPVMYLTLMIVQHKMSPKPADPQQQQQQRMMMTIMPVMFFFIFYSMPSGLVLYFVASMVFTIAEQYLIRRSLAAQDPVAVAAGGGGGGGASATGARRDASPQRAPELPDGQQLSKRKKKGRRK